MQRSPSLGKNLIFALSTQNVEHLLPKGELKFTFWQKVLDILRTKGKNELFAGLGGKFSPTAKIKVHLWGYGEDIGRVGTVVDFRGSGVVVFKIF